MAEGAMSAFLTSVAAIVTQILTWVDCAAPSGNIGESPERITPR